MVTLVVRRKLYEFEIWISNWNYAYISQIDAIEEEGLGRSGHIP